MDQDQPASELPMPRELLRSLLKEFAKMPPPPPPINPSTASNSLKHLTLNHRPLLLTLHVLFPGILLQALDLIDRHAISSVTTHNSTLYFVRSANGPAYEVRLRAWNCDCAVFAFAVFRLKDGTNTPVCNHLLACALVSQWGGIGGEVEERKVGEEEMAGIVAG